MAGILYKEESYKIIGACFEVYKDMGCGFLEPVYQECSEIEFTERGIPFAPQEEIRIVYKGRVLEQTYKPDFVCYEKIIVELKVLSHLTGEHQVQVWNYLKATGFRLGLLINFGHRPQLEHVRIVLRDLLVICLFFRVFRVFRGLYLNSSISWTPLPGGYRRVVDISLEG